MIIQERFTIDGTEYVKTYSDAGRYVVRGGVSYEEACDPAELSRTYTEGDMMPESIEDKAEAYDILMGVTK